jgi:hypothetical protein
MIKEVYGCCGPPPCDAASLLRLWAVWETRRVFQEVWKTEGACQDAPQARPRFPYLGPVHSLSAFLLLSVSAQTLTKAKRLTDELEAMGSIRQTIQQGCGQAFVAKDLGPIGKAQIGGDQQSHPFVEGRAKLKQQMRARW